MILGLHNHSFGMGEDILMKLYTNNGLGMWKKWAKNHECYLTGLPVTQPFLKKGQSQTLTYVSSNLTIFCHGW